MQYLPLDRVVANNVVLQLPVGPQGPALGAPNTPGVPGGARYAPSTTNINGKQYVNIKFQFPPKMVSDNRKSTWEEASEQPDSEPTFAFKFSGPRKMSLSWSYVVDSFDTANSNAWTVQRITHYVRSVRGYPIAGRKSGAGNDNADEQLVAYFRMWAIGGSHTASIRITNVDVKYGEALIVPNNDPRSTFPLRTDITADISLWTPGTGEGGTDDPLARVRGLVPLWPVWY